MTYPITAPASGAYPIPTNWGLTAQFLNTDQNNSNAVGNYAWGAADSAPVGVRVATTGSETYTIVSGSVTQISGTTIDTVSVAVNDLIVIKDAPAASGPGVLNSTQPGNGIYYVTAVGANISVARAATMSPGSANPNPAGRIVFVRAGSGVNASSIFQVTTPFGNAAFIYGTTAMQWTQYVLTPAISVPPARRPQRNTIAAVGDSITALGSEGWLGPWLGHTWFNWLPVLTHQRIRWGGANFAVSGTPIANQQTVQLPQVLAMNPLPGACVLAVGTNDIQSTSWDFNLEVTTLKQMVASLLAVGVVPILWCPPPNNHVGTVSVATVHARTYQWCTWVRRFAALNGYAVVDAFTALTQADGTGIPGAIDSGLTHPTGYGHRLIAQQAIADGLADIFPPNSLVHTARTTDDLTNMFGNGTINWGLFTTDSNSDGVADGLGGSGSGTHTFSIVAPNPNDELVGNWQQSTANAGANSLLTASFTTGWSVGDTIAFSCRIQTSGVEASGGVYLVALLTDTPGGYTIPAGSEEAPATLTYLWNGIVNWDGDIDDGELYAEVTIPSAATDLQLWINIAGTLTSAVTLRVGEVTVRNLTTGGLLV